MRKTASAVTTGSEQTVSPKEESCLVEFPVERAQQRSNGERPGGESLFYVAPPDPRARALGWKLYLREAEMERYLRKLSRCGS